MKPKNNTLMKQFILYFVFIMLFMFTIQLASALSVSPAKYEEFYEAPKNYFFKISNDQDIDLNLKIILEGDLKDYATTNDHIIVGPGDTKALFVNLDVPKNNNLKPGINKLLVRLIDVSTKEGIGASAELVPVIKIMIPYDRPYLSYSWNAQNNNPLISTVMLQNIGEGVLELKPKLAIFDNNKSIIEEEKAIIKLNSKEIQKIIFNNELPVGEYEARLYLGDIIETKKVTAGTPNYKMIEALVSDFKPGKIVKFVIELELDWNKELDSEIIGTIRGVNQTWDLDSQKVIFKPHETNKIILYWDSANYGTYDLDLKTISGSYIGLIKTSFVLEPEKFNHIFWIILILIIILLLFLVIKRFTIKK